MKKLRLRTWVKVVLATAVIILLFVLLFPGEYEKVIEEKINYCVSQGFSRSSCIRDYHY